MNIWLVSREYAGIAEAGGVKNVSCSLSESLVRFGHRVTLFMPLYKCTNLDHVEDFSCFYKSPKTFNIAGKNVTVAFSHGFMNGVEIVFVCHKDFAEKRAVYTYTSEDELEDPSHRQGQGHQDVAFLDTLFQYAVTAFGSMCTENEHPDVVHCQDGATAMIPFIARNSEYSGAFSGTRFAITIHNAGPGYHHEYHDMKEAEYYTGLSSDVLSYGLNGLSVEPFILGSKYAKITTVSPEYASEILQDRTDTQGLSKVFALHGTEITGITNGIDFLRYDPQNPEASLLPFNFDPQRGDLDGKYSCRKYFLEKYASSSCPVHEMERYGSIDFPEGKTADDFVYVCYHGRVVGQKGIEILSQAARNILGSELPVKFILLGQGDPSLEKKLMELAVDFAGSCVYLKGYDRVLSRLGIASSDFALMPSFFEPCGLEDFIAQTFGTIPVAHRTGGLCKILDDETGYLYSPNTSSELEKALVSLVKIMHGAGRDIFNSMISWASRYIHQNYSWNKVALEYVKLYESI